MAKVRKTRLIRVSRISPYRNCKVGGPGTNFVNTAVEPWLAVSPVRAEEGNPQMIGVWQQDRWSNGGAHGLIAAFSRDGGKTWRRTTLPFSKCAVSPLKFKRASDPFISIGPDGKAYAVALSVNVDKNGKQIALSAITAVTSSDGGKTWRNFRVIQSDEGPKIINDKESVTADPHKPGVAYVVWDRITQISGPAFFSKTMDGGRTWSKPRIIFHPGKGNQTVGNQITIDPRSGIMYNFFNWIMGATTKTPQFFITVQKSQNGGKTWSRPKIIAPFNSVAVRDPVTGKVIRGGGDALPEVAINQRTGELFVVWQSAKFSGGKFDEIAISRSVDRGRTWSTPVRVNPALGRAAFTPMVRVNQNSVVGVSYYMIHRNHHSKNRVPVDYWFTYSTNDGRTFKPPLHIAGPFNMLRAPESKPPFVPGLFVGDYQGMATFQNDFHLFFSKVNFPSEKDPVDVYTTVVRVNKYRTVAGTKSSIQSKGSSPASSHLAPRWVKTSKPVLFV